MSGKVTSIILDGGTPSGVVSGSKEALTAYVTALSRFGAVYRDGEQPRLELFRLGSKRYEPQ